MFLFLFGFFLYPVLVGGFFRAGFSSILRGDQKIAALREAGEAIQRHEALATALRERSKKELFILSTSIKHVGFSPQALTIQ